MMIDGKGCGAIIGIAMLTCFFGGLIAMWLGAPWWAPVVAALVPPVCAAALGLLATIMWMADGSH